MPFENYDLCGHVVGGSPKRATKGRIFEINLVKTVVLTEAEVEGYRPQAALIQLAESQFTRHLSLDGLHGRAHWNAVLENGLFLAKLTGADPKVVTCFSIFHDCCRWDNLDDLEHGFRAAEYLRSIRQRIPLPDDAFQLLVEACRWHNHPVNTHDSQTVMVCWDADRLNLFRAGIAPDPKQLCTDAARRHPDVIAQANRRAAAMVFIED